MPRLQESNTRSEIDTFRYSVVLLLNIATTGATITKPQIQCSYDRKIAASVSLSSFVDVAGREFLETQAALADAFAAVGAAADAFTSWD